MTAAAPMVDRVTVLGGGSAGFMAALALKLKSPRLAVRVIRSKDIGVIGVGEGSTATLTRFLHDYLRIGMRRFLATANPTWKLGLKFIWGPRDHFFYTFNRDTLDLRLPQIARSLGYYCDDDILYDQNAALMAHDRAFPRGRDGQMDWGQGRQFSYHFENERYVEFLEGYAVASGVEVVDDTVREVLVDDSGVTALRLASGADDRADLYVDASGFASLLLGKTLREPFESFATSLFCDRAVVGGWTRTGEPIKPYTTCETMDSGWCWQIDHEARINRGYVYSSAFVSDDDAEREFRATCPQVGPTRVVRFASGCYARSWVKNVVAIGNASGFVEPLEASALGVIAMQSQLLADTLHDTRCRPTRSQVRGFNTFHARNWAAIRGFIAAHYKFNRRLDTPFWRHCHEHTELADGTSIVEYFAENGFSKLWEPTMLEPYHQFGLAGYYALLHGMRVPHASPTAPTDAETRFLNDRRQKMIAIAQRGVWSRRPWPRPADRVGKRRGASPSARYRAQAKTRPPHRQWTMDN